MGKHFRKPIVAIATTALVVVSALILLGATNKPTSASSEQLTRFERELLQEMQEHNQTMKRILKALERK